MQKYVVSLADYSGAWAEPFIKFGYKVILVDPKHGGERGGQRGMVADMKPWVGKRSDDVYLLGATAGFAVCLFKMGRLFNFIGAPEGEVDVVLAAPPCTDFSVSGARWWAGKDERGDTKLSVQIVNECLDFIYWSRPRCWALENPVGRIAKMCKRLSPEARLLFHPSDYAGWADDPSTEAYTKRTCLWGHFDTDLEKKPIEPVMYVGKNGKRGSYIWAKLGGKSERTKELRSMTPIGFSRAFADRNAERG